MGNIGATGPVINRVQEAIKAGMVQAKQEEKEVISGADYVTKTLGIPVDIKCLYDKNGNLTKDGKEIQKNIKFKQKNKDSAIFYGKSIGWEGETRNIKPYIFNNDTVKKIKFEATNISKIPGHFDIAVKFFDKDGNIPKDGEIFIYCNKQ